MPTLILAGELDHKYAGIASEMGKRMAKAMVKLVPDAGHTIHLEQPEVFDARVCAFLSEIGES
jgi:2-succinyl-6-hydroxy-2,4-cyclohexadiene-1-carboxylate synthase